MSFPQHPVENYARGCLLFAVADLRWVEVEPLDYMAHHLCHNHSLVATLRLHIISYRSRQYRYCVRPFLPVLHSTSRQDSHFIVVCQLLSWPEYAQNRVKDSIRQEVCLWTLQVSNLWVPNWIEPTTNEHSPGMLCLCGQDSPNKWWSGIVSTSMTRLPPTYIIGNGRIQRGSWSKNHWSNNNESIAKCKRDQHSFRALSSNHCAEGRMSYTSFQLTLRLTAGLSWTAFSVKAYITHSNMTIPSMFLLSCCLLHSRLLSIDDLPRGIS
jgi:hypothetical protein